MTDNEAKNYVKSKIRDIYDFPVKGIVFKDITTVLRDKEGFKNIIDFFTAKYADKKIDYITGMESRGFIFGSALAYNIGAGFVPLRKPGKLPAETIKQEYELEYGTNTLEMHKDAIESGSKVLIIDDLLATGGTADAACKLVSQSGAEIVGVAFVIELKDLNGRNKLPKDIEVVSMLSF